MKKLLTVIFAYSGVFFCYPFVTQAATSQVIISSSILSANSSRTIHLGAADNAVGNTTAPVPMPASGTLANMQVRLNSGVTTADTFSIVKNGVTTQLSCSIAAGATVCQDSAASHAVSVAPGDTVYISMTAGGSVTSSNLVGVALDFTPTVSGETVLFGRATALTSGSSVLYRTFVATPPAFSATTESTTTAQRVPVAGTMSYFCTNNRAAPGAGTSLQILVRKNFADTALSATFADTFAGVTCDTTNSFSLVANDLFGLRTAPTGSPSGNTTSFSAKFVPTNPNTFILLGGSVAVSTSATAFVPAHSVVSSFSTVDNTMSAVTNRMQVTSMSVLLSAPPGGSASYAVTLRKNQSNTSMSCTVVGAAYTCTSSTPVQFVDGDRVSVSVIPSSTPAAAGVLVSLVANKTTNTPTTDAKHKYWGGLFRFIGGSVRIR